VAPIIPPLAAVRDCRLNLLTQKMPRGPGQFGLAAVVPVGPVKIDVFSSALAHPEISYPIIGSEVANTTLWSSHVPEFQDSPGRRGF
jgi:hypothetical protein